MNPLTDKQLTTLGFALKPLQQDPDDTTGFSYRVAILEGKTSFVEVINEYNHSKLTQQFMNFEIIEDGEKSVDISLIKKLKKIII